LALLTSTSLLFTVVPAQAANRAAGGDGTEAAQALLLPDGTTRLLDQPYGDSPRQRFDVYLPAQPFSSPDPLRKETDTMPGRALVLMVHGGAWVAGDKTMPRVVDHKMRHWLEQGVAFASTDYRLLPEAPGPIEQARDVALALARLQQRATDWGVDPKRIVLVGHSAGAHLVALLSANPAMAYEVGAQPWLGSVLLDSAALDLEAEMKTVAPAVQRLYRRAFGSDEQAWAQYSPLRRLTSDGVTMLVVCSTLRRNDACEPARTFARRAESLSVDASVLPTRRTHAQINDELGLPNDYTQAVDVFLGRLDAAFLPRRR
jgi:acetyl esterase/lipase